MTEESIYNDESIYKDTSGDTGENRKTLSVPDKTKAVKRSLRKSVLMVEKEAEEELKRDADSNKSSYSKNLRSYAMELPNKFGDSGKSEVFDLEKDAEIRIQKGEISEDFLNTVWGVNYREAAIYLLEGIENRSFEKHPADSKALKFYLLVNNPIFQCLDFILSALLLVLGYFRARRGHDDLEIYELITYLSMAVLMIIKTSFLGIKAKGLADLRSHGMTVIKWVILIVLIVDSATSLAGLLHGRYLWCLKIIFIIDCYYTRPLRKLVREIYHTLPALIEMLFALLFCALFFSVTGFYLFSTYTHKKMDNGVEIEVKEDGNPFFESFYDTFMNMFVLINTSNFPDIMTFSQNKNSTTVLFFMIYIGLTTCFILNLLVAIIYEMFESEDKERFKETFMRKREAIKFAFELLVTKSNPDKIAYVHFSEFIPYFLSFPKLYSFNLFKKFSMTTRDKLLNFKMLDRSNEGFLSIEEFYSVYDALEYTWIATDSLEVENFIQGGMKDCWNKFSSGVKKMVLNPWFDRTVILVVIINCILLLVVQTSEDYKIPKPYSTIFSTSFAVIYFLEMVFKLIALGARQYFSNPWNIIDFIIAWGGAILEITRHIYQFKTTLVSVARSLKLLTLFRLRETFREVFETLALMIPKVATFFVIILLGQYSFAEVGIELFGGPEFNPTDCCNGTIVANYYNTKINGNLTYSHFENKSEAFETLFDLFVERNWELAVAFETLSGNRWCRGYFMVYQIFSIVMFSYITALILHAFLLKTRYAEKTEKEVGDVLVDTTRVVLNKDEVKFLNQINATRGILPDPTLIMTNCEHLEFEGINFIVTDELHHVLNEEHIKDWIEHENFFNDSNKKKGVVSIFRKSMRSKSKRKNKNDSLEKRQESNIAEPEIVIEAPPNN